MTGVHQNWLSLRQRALLGSRDGVEGRHKLLERSSKASQALPCESRESWVLQRSQKVGARTLCTLTLLRRVPAEEPWPCLCSWQFT